MTNRTLRPASAAALAGGRRCGGLGLPLVAAVVIALVAAGGGREPRFRELGLLVGG